ncbi:tRNA glutamyl-Q(34) synthetase GluQRS [Rhodoferax sp. 4810]|uniref:Glutamyl-Q tRNA(Asp) synthetase n=1 Tax=Thiospirillum jenense TaxID=1653858 RepID=A0A839HDM9_9GAMM|nr:tRNA glutamyl-Q(34) synthetase GluQRS [Rhodoferax jenense]MBB1125287.1 tRNA glutamyl-Q(34) synthetase GluQRS [Thiospirillum jenense]
MPKTADQSTPYPAATHYCGRFAPSPSGALHRGSLATAVGSFADARAHGGAWRVRIDDLDQARTVPGAAADILRTLDAFGLHWDGEIRYQHQHLEHYHAALAQLRRDGHCYPCGCSRTNIAATARAGECGAIYPGTCRAGLPPGTIARSERLRTPDQMIIVTDRLHGFIQQNLFHDCGDFILRRADGFIAYQFAVVIDDALDGINQVVRGADLLHATPRQCYLQHLLGLARPQYAHLPLVIDAHGRKLSKSDAAAPVLINQPIKTLRHIWHWLGQAPLPIELTTVREFWQAAIPLWSFTTIPLTAKPLPNYSCST